MGTVLIFDSLIRHRSGEPAEMATVFIFFQWQALFKSATQK